MPIIVKAEVKTLLGLEDTSKNVLIDMLIPLVQREVTRRCNNSFTMYSTRVFAAGVEFQASGKKIIIQQDDLASLGYASGCDVKVYGSSFNEGVFAVKTMAVAGGATTLTLEDAEVLVDETADYEVTITRVKFPPELKIDAAHIINHYLTTQGKLVREEALPGGYRVVYKSDDEVWRCLDKYRKPFA